MPFEVKLHNMKNLHLYVPGRNFSNIEISELHKVVVFFVGCRRTYALIK